MHKWSKANFAHSVTAIAFLVGAALHVSCAHAAEASFDCNAAVLADEKIICSDSLLSHADYLLGQSYSALMASLTDPARREALRSDQHNWLLLRNQECGVTKQTKLTDDDKVGYVDCFLAAYEERAADLENIKANPDKSPSAISTPIRKAQFASDYKTSETEKSLTSTNLHVGDEPRLVWTNDGRLLALAKPPGAKTASLFVWKPGQKDTVSFDTDSEPVNVQKVCIDGSDIVLIRKAPEDAEPAAATIKPGITGGTLVWGPVPADVATACRFDMHRRLISSRGGHVYLDFGYREKNGESDDRFIKLYKDDTPITLNPPIRIDRRLSLQGEYLPAANMFVVSTTDRSADITTEILRRWAKDNCLPFWQINATSGDVSRVCVPFGPYIKSPPLPFVTKVGNFFTAEDSGIYRIEGSSTVPVINEPVTASALSPDQCHIAFATDSANGSNTPIQILDVCKSLPK